MVSGLSIIIPFLNESQLLPAFLASILRLKHSNIELIFVDAGSKDNSREVVEEFKFPKTIAKKIISNSNDELLLPGAARNLGLVHAQNEIIAFLDIGTIPEDDWLERQLNSEEFKSYGAVLGSCKFAPEGFVATIQCALSAGVGSSSDTLPGTVISREGLVKIGKFRNDLRSGEDLIWKEDFHKNFPNKFNSRGMIKYNSYSNSIVSNLQKWLVYSRSAILSGKSHLQAMLYFLFYLILIFAAILDFQLFFYIFIFYFLIRGFVDPVRRSKKRLWFGQNLGMLFFAPFMALSLDFVKFLGFILGYIKLIRVDNIMR
jgi:glycosyltransferase involved in cell wall biosynthesis